MLPFTFSVPSQEVLLAVVRGRELTERKKHTHMCTHTYTQTHTRVALALGASKGCLHRDTAENIT